MTFHPESTSACNIATRWPDEQPNPNLRNHGPNSLTLATVRAGSYPKPYGAPQPYYRAGVTTPNPSEVGEAVKDERSHRTWEGQCFRAHPHFLVTSFHMYGFLGPRPPRITHGRVVSSTRPRSLRCHLNYVTLNLK